MTKIIEFVVTVLTTASLISILGFICYILYKVFEWMENNRIIAKWLDKTFKAGEQNESRKRINSW